MKLKMNSLKTQSLWSVVMLHDFITINMQYSIDSVIPDHKWFCYDIILLQITLP